MPLSVLFGLQKHSTTGASACPFLVSDFILQLTYDLLCIERGNLYRFFA